MGKEESSEHIISRTLRGCETGQGGGGQGLYRSVLPSPQPHVLRPLGTNCGPEGVAFVWQVKEHSLLATESFVTCGHCPTFSVPTWQPSPCFISEYKVSFHRQPLKQKVCLLFQGKLFKKTHLKDLTLTNMCFAVVFLVILI